MKPESLAQECPVTRNEKEPVLAWLADELGLSILSAEQIVEDIERACYRLGGSIQDGAEPSPEHPVNDGGIRPRHTEMMERLLSRQRRLENRLAEVRERLNDLI